MSDQKIDLDALEKLAEQCDARDRYGRVNLTTETLRELIRMARAAPSPKAGQADHIADDLTMVAAPSADSAGVGGESVAVAQKARSDLSKRIREFGTPPHSDYWHREIFEADARIERARRGATLPPPPVTETKT